MAVNPRNPDAAYRDRSAGLVIFGVLEILLGVGCAFLVPLSLLAWSVSSSSASFGSTFPVLMIYAVTAVGFIWLGVGSIRARRWARDLTLAVSRVWLVTGICTMLVAAFAMPVMMQSLGAAEGLPPETLLVAKAVTLAVVCVIYVLLPAAFVLFYRSPDVVATCRERDPKPQFTDGCPPRLLTLAVVWGLGAVSVLVMPVYGWAFPFFGTVLSGAAGAAPWLVVLLVCVGLAWGTCRRRAWAWRGAVLGTFAAALSTIVTSFRVSPQEVVRALPIAEDQAQLLNAISWPQPWVVTLLWVVAWASMLVYLLTVRSEFTPQVPRADG